MNQGGAISDRPDHEKPVKSALLTSLASHGHRRTDSAAPWGATLLIRIACNRTLKGITPKSDPQRSSPRVTTAINPVAHPEPYNSRGNGSAMRASPIAWVAEDLDWALEEAARSAEVTHNHPSGIKGAQAVVAAVFLARCGASKDEIRDYLTTTFGYDLHRTVEEIRPRYMFDVSCDGSVPEAIIAFLDSTDFENSIRKAISLGGDSDSIASIAGAIAHAFYEEIPDWMTSYCLGVLDPAQRSIIDDFWKRFPAADIC
jgi:ADP-ribosylglycohydrolase